MIEGELTKASLTYLASTPLAKRKELGQYMTPRGIANIILKHLKIKDGDKVLDPACGTGELLLAVKRTNPEASLFGWDIDGEILKVARKNLGKESRISNKDALKATNYEGVFDIVIANPPYFEFQPDLQQREYYSEVISGRANMYALFFKKSLEVVKENGFLAFIVPPSMNNGGYFHSLREYLLKNSEIKFMKVISDPTLFLGAQTSVQVLILQKKTKPKVNQKYIVNLRELTGSRVSRFLFTEDAKKFKENWVGAESIYNLGYDVITGPLSWNQYRVNLSPRQENKYYLPVYYSKDIGQDGKISFNNAMDTRRYMDSKAKTPLSGEAILVNRIVGGVGTGSLRGIMVSGSYFAENHVNVIIPRKGVPQKISLKRLHKKLIGNDELSSYIQAFTGNTQLSASELKYFIPIKS